MYSKRDMILDSASWLFTKYGLKKTTVDDISKASKCGKGTIYLHFKTKDAIFYEVVRREIRQMLEHIAAAVAAAPTTRDKVETFFLATTDEIKQYVNFYQISREVLEEIESEVARDLRQEFIASLAAIVDTILQCAEEREGRRIEEREVVCLAIASCAEAIKGPWFFGGRELDVQAKARALSRLVLSGITM